MRNEIEPYRDQPLDAYEDAAPASEQADAGASLFKYVDILRRRWLTVVLLWPLVLVPAVAGVWLSAKVTYTATAQVELRGGPMESVPGSALGSLDSKLVTQALLMTSQRVLLAALASPRLKDRAVGVHSAPDPLAAIRDMVSASHIRNSHIVELRVESANREDAVVIAWAVLEAYLSQSEEVKRKSIEEAIKIAEDERERFRSLMEAKRNDISGLASVYGATDAKMFDLIRESKLKLSEDTNRALEQARTDVDRLEYELKQAEEGKLSELMMASDPTRLLDAIDSNTTVRSRRQVLQAAEDHLARLINVGLTDAATEIKKAKKNVEDWKAKVKEAEDIAVDDIEKQWKAMTGRVQDTVVRNLKVRLDMARALRAELEDRVKKVEEECLAVGKTGVRIQELQDDMSLLHQQFQEWDKKAQDRRIESRHLSQIIVASEPEVRPDGVKDKRVKLSAAAVFGTLFFALAVAFLKDYLDPRVHAPQQVETGLGLRLLGLVPSLKDLKEGRITEGEFAESYRLVRACLSVAGPNGSQPRSILTTSAQACEGKTSLAVSLAASLAEAGNSVLLIDGDIQGPQVERVLKLDAVHTLKDVLAGDVNLAEAVVRSNLQHLEVLVARLDSGTARGVLNTRTAVRLIRDAMERYDYVVVDSPPTLGAADAVVWAEAVDGVILSSFAGQSNSHAIKMACQRLRSVGAKILGAVMCNLSIREGYYSFSTSSMSARSTHPNAAQNGSRPSPHVQLPVVEIHPSEPGSKSV